MVQYNVRLDNNPVKLCIGREGAKVVDMNARKVLHSWAFGDLSQVVPSPSNIKFVYGNLMRSDEAVFITYLGTAIKQVVERFSNAH